MTGLVAPDLGDVLAARRRIEPYLRPTPLYGYPALDSLAGTKLFVKHENHQPVGAFKVRGGVNLVSQLSADERRRGVITASTGNHGQSVAYAANVFGVHAIVCMPEQANPVKVESMRALGAEIVFHGRDLAVADAPAPGPDRAGDLPEVGGAGSGRPVSPSGRGATGGGRVRSGQSEQ